MLGKQIGQELDLAQLQAARHSEREAQYEMFLQREYNLTKEQAAKMLNEAMAAEREKALAKQKRKRFG